MASVYAMLARGDDAALHVLVQDQAYANWLFDGFPKDPPRSIAAYGESDEPLRRTELPTSAPAFRIPESREFEFWNEWAAKKIVELVGEDDIEVRLVWSDVPGATLHPADEHLIEEKTWRATN